MYNWIAFHPLHSTKSPATKLITAPITLLKEVWREILQTDSSNRLISQDERNNRGTDGLSEEFKKLKKCVCLFVLAFFSLAFEVPFVLFRIKIAKTEFSV